MKNRGIYSERHVIDAEIRKKLDFEIEQLKDQIEVLSLRLQRLKPPVDYETNRQLAKEEDQYLTDVLEKKRQKMLRLKKLIKERNRYGSLN